MIDEKSLEEIVKVSISRAFYPSEKISEIGYIYATYSEVENNIKFHYKRVQIGVLLEPFEYIVEDILDGFKNTWTFLLFEIAWFIRVNGEMHTHNFFLEQELS